MINYCPVCGDFDLEDWCDHCQVSTKQRETLNGCPEPFENEFAGFPSEMIDSEGHTIELPDGYDGDILPFFVVPIEEANNLIKLRCATPGKEYLIKWTRQSDYDQAMKKAGFIQKEGE